MHSIENILDRLQKVRKNGHGWVACCPAHEDRVQSLSINAGDDGRVLLYCHAGCQFDAVVNALGLKTTDLFLTSGNAITRSYSNKATSSTPPIAQDIVSEMHVALNEKQRTYLKTRRMLSDAVIDRYGLGICKYYDEIRVAIPIFGADGTVFDVRRWLPPERRTKESPKILFWKQGYGKARLYPIDQLEQEHLVLCAGELDALAAISTGIHTITATCGENYWSDELSLPFKGKTVTVIMDHDKTGIEGAQKRAELLTETGATVKIASWPKDRSKGWDITDELVKYGPDGLKRILEEAKPFHNNQSTEQSHSSPHLICLADVKSKPIEWLWPGRIALGKLSLIAGDPGLGKSLLSIDLAARVSLGSQWPDSQEKCPSGSVIILSAEDDLEDTIRPRCDAAGANASKISCLQFVELKDRKTGKSSQRTFCLKTDLEILERAIQLLSDCRLVIIDPISAYLGLDVNSHNTAEIRAVLAPFSEFAAKHRVALLGVTHLNKNDKGPGVYRVMGSLAFVAAARAAWGVVKDKDHPARRLFLPIKNNIAKDTTGLAYEIKEFQNDPKIPILEWDAAPINTPLDEILSSTNSGADESAEREYAIGWLKKELDGKHALAKEVFERAKDNGISQTTLKRASAEIGVIKEKREFRGSWIWRLPDKEYREEDPSPTTPGGTLCKEGQKTAIEGHSTKGDHHSSWYSSRNSLIKPISTKECQEDHSENRGGEGSGQNQEDVQPDVVEVSRDI